MRLLSAFIAALCLCAASAAYSQLEEISTREIKTGLTLPWEILWGPDNWLWFTERNGTVKRLNPETGEERLLLTISNVGFEHESGLMGMALYPFFKASPYVYLAHTYTIEDDYFLKIVRYSYQNDTLTQPFILLDSIRGNIIHIGCRLVIAPDMTMFITTGDAGNKDLPLSLDTYSGKILRINLDGSIPADNPFPGSAIWSYGHRNPQGLVLSPKGILYSSEHGDSNDDEINIITKGGDYGWPKVEGFCDQEWEKEYCDTVTTNDPMIVWQPTIAVCGIDYYDHSSAPQWQNSIILTTLKGSTLVLLKLDSAGQKFIGYKDILNNYGRLRDICISPSGKVYLCTSNGDDDKIIEITPVPFVSVQENSPLTEDFKVFPNPIANNSTVEFSLLKEQFVKLNVYNALGKKVATVFKGMAQAGKNTVPLNAAALPAGVYTCRLVAGNTSAVLQFIHIQ